MQLPGTFLTFDLRKGRLLEQDTEVEVGIQMDGSDSRYKESPCGGQESSDHFLFFPSYPDSIHRLCLVTMGVGNQQIW